MVLLLLNPDSCLCALMQWCLSVCVYMYTYIIYVHT